MFGSCRSVSLQEIRVELISSHVKTVYNRTKMFIGIWTYLPYNGIFSVKILMAKNSRDIFLEAANTLLAAGYISNTLTSPVK